MKFSIGSLLLSINFIAYSQTYKTINTDRPDQSDGVYTLEKGNFQIETGSVLGKESETYIFNNSMLRYGISKNTEVRLLLDVGRIGDKKGFTPTGFSIKQNLIHQNNIIPEITAVAYIRCPLLASKDFKMNRNPATFLLAFQNDLSEQFKLGYNIGIFYDGESSQERYITTINLSNSISKNTSVFVEYFSQLDPHNKPLHNYDFGLLYLIKNDLQIDFAIGSSFSRNESNSFTTTGFSYNF